MGVYLCAKFEVSSIILTVLDGVISPPPQNEPLKSPPRLGLKNDCKPIIVLLAVSKWQLYLDIRFARAILLSEVFVSISCGLLLTKLHALSLGRQSLVITYQNNKVKVIYVSLKTCNIRYQPRLSPQFFVVQYLLECFILFGEGHECL